MEALAVTILAIKGKSVWLNIEVPISRTHDEAAQELGPKNQHI
jgi:hypothetical protein